jgi:hypothetical protein
MARYNYAKGSSEYIFHINRHERHFHIIQIAYAFHKRHVIQF